MGKVSKERRKRDYFEIYEQIHTLPTASIVEIAKGTGLSRNTVSKYLKQMSAERILHGPCLEMNPHTTHKEYVYLLNFSDPLHVFEGLKGFPHVLYHAITFGDWNTIVITNKLLDFSQLTGFQTFIFRGVKGYCTTPKIKWTTWDEGFKQCREEMESFTQIQERRESIPVLNWGSDEWKLYHAFKFGLRRTVTPLLRKIKVRYETYMRWMETLKDHCTIHTAFYPEGYDTYLNYCFLFSSSYKKSVMSLFASLPTPPFVVEADGKSLVFVRVITSDAARKLFCMIYKMKAAKIIEGSKHAMVLSGYHAKIP